MRKLISLILLALALGGCAKHAFDMDDISQVRAEEQRRGWTLFEVLGGTIPNKGDYAMAIRTGSSGHDVSMALTWTVNKVQHEKERPLNNGSFPVRRM